MILETIATFIGQLKYYLLAVFVAFIASSIKWVENRRKLREGNLDKTKIKIITLIDWFLFGVMASIITITALSLFEHLGYEFTPLIIVLLFWLAWLTDYLFQWIPIKLKKILKKYED